MSFREDWEKDPSEAMDKVRVKCDKMEEDIKRSIDFGNTDDTHQSMMVCSLVSVVADLIVMVCTKEPPKVPAPIVDLEGVSKGLQIMVRNLTEMTAAAVRDAEANGVTIALRPPRSRRPPDTSGEAGTSGAPSEGPAPPGEAPEAGAADGDPARHAAEAMAERIRETTGLRVHVVRGDQLGKFLGEEG